MARMDILAPDFSQTYRDMPGPTGPRKVQRVESSLRQWHQNPWCTNNHYCLGQRVWGSAGWLQRNNTWNSTMCQGSAPLAGWCHVSPVYSVRSTPSLGYSHSCRGWRLIGGKWGGRGDRTKDSEWQVLKKLCNFQKKKKVGGGYLNPFRTPKLELTTFLLGVGWSNKDHIVPRQIRLAILARELRGHASIFFPNLRLEAYVYVCVPATV